MVEKPEIKIEKEEADIMIYHECRLICCIEVSGSDKVRMPKPIWIRPDKLEHAKSKVEETLFYMVYPSEIRVLTKETVEKYEDNVVTVHIKKNKHGRRVPEGYIEIPHHESSDEEEMFDWIEEQMT